MRGWARIALSTMMCVLAAQARNTGYIHVSPHLPKCDGTPVTQLAGPLAKLVAAIALRIRITVKASQVCVYEWQPWRKVIDASKISKKCAF